MKNTRGKSQQAGVEGPSETAVSVYECDGFCPEQTLAERQQEALGKMMHGLRLLIAALYLFLLAETAVAEPAATDSSVSGLLGWGLLFFVLLIVAGATWHQTRHRKTRRDPVDRSAAAARPERSPEAEAESDDLEGLIDPAVFDHHAAAHWERCVRQESHLALIAMAVDSSDPGVGNGPDRLAEAVGQSISGLVKYHGGLMSQTEAGEFRIVAANLNPGEAVELAEDLQAAVEDLVLVSPEDPGRPVTASFGLAVSKPDEQTSLAGFVCAARAALDKAVQQGGNRIAQASPGDHA